MELKHGFKKLNSMQYEYVVPKDVFEKIDKTLETISNGYIDKYLDVHNMAIFDTMLGRYIATLFIDTGEVIDNHYGMAVIIVKFEDRTFRISVGLVPLSKEQEYYVSGILYD